ncbi:(2Fe-2S) ferredoxin domain-containing protein [Pseudomonas sp. LRF_L74]|uniref:(2Fe-2S) ferredoxin domain-containing protein n=1 Tax=Pseudomonas sp. LRF_L74 TaxID=3369422 RepID=UPI003F60A863
MSASPYTRVLFVGPDLLRGSFAELFRQQLSMQFGEQALAAIVDTTTSYEALWQRLESLDGTTLLIDLDPQTSSQQFDWLRSELQVRGKPEWLFVAPGDAAQVAALPMLIADTSKHLPCERVETLPTSHSWSHIPVHDYRVLLCNGPRCTRRGALPLWKALREQLKAAGKLECAGGVHITRTQCQFPCDQGPTLSVYPPGAWYQVRDEADVRRLVEEQFIGGRAVDELLMRPL